MVPCGATVSTGFLQSYAVWSGPPPPPTPIQQDRSEAKGSVSLPSFSSLDIRIVGMKEKH